MPNPQGPPTKRSGQFANGNKMADDTTVEALSSASPAEVFPPGPPRRVIMAMGLGGAAPATIIFRRASNHQEVARLDVPAEHSSALTELTGVAGGLEAILAQPADDISVRVWSEE